MEKRLQDFILSVQQLSDLRNLDVFNPIVFQMEHPINATRYTIVGAKLEPSYLGVPINVTWVVLDPTDPYYMQALKLKTTLDSETVSNKPKVVGLDAWWHVVRTYDEIFNDPQYYLGTSGPAGADGPVGPTGPAGPEGPQGTSVDPAVVMALLGSLSGSLEIRGPSAVLSETQAGYEVWLTESVVDAQGVVTSQTRQVYPPVRLQQSGATPLPAGTVMSYDNVLAVGATNVPVGAKLVAEYPSWTRIVQTTFNVTLGQAAPTVVSLALSGPSVLAEGGTAQFTATATYSDGTTQLVTASWVSSDAAVASVDASGYVTTSDVAQSSDVTLTATFEGVSSSITFQVSDIATITGLAITGASAIFEGTSSQYSAVVTYSDGTTQLVTASWSVDDAAVASISTSGMLSASQIATDAPVVVTASYNSFTATKSVQVTNLTAVSLSISGPSALTGGDTGQYSATATFNNGTSSVVPVTWSVGANATVDASGVVTADNVDGVSVLTATYAPAGGSSLSATKSITISTAMDAGYPYYGVGPAAPADWQSFILGLPYRGPTASVIADIAFDALGQNAYMYFCYPKSYGEAQFFDKLSQFFGGWGGGGNSGPGPSAVTIAAGMDKPYEATITYNGVPTVFYVYRSEYANLGAAASNQWAVSQLP